MMMRRVIFIGLCLIFESELAAGATRIFFSNSSGAICLSGGGNELERTVENNENLKVAITHWDDSGMLNNLTANENSLVLVNNKEGNTRGYYSHKTGFDNHKGNLELMIDLEMVNKKLDRSHFAGHVNIQCEACSHGQHQLNYSYILYSNQPTLVVWLDGNPQQFHLSSDPYLNDPDEIDDFVFGQVILRIENFESVRIHRGICKVTEELSSEEIIIIVLIVVATLVGVIMLITCAYCLCPIILLKLRLCCYENCCMEKHVSNWEVDKVDKDINSNPRNSFFALESSEDDVNKWVDSSCKLGIDDPGNQPSSLMEPSKEELLSLQENQHEPVTEKLISLVSESDSENGMRNSKMYPVIDPDYGLTKADSFSEEERYLLKQKMHNISLDNLEPVPELFPSLEDKIDFIDNSDSEIEDNEERLK